MCILLTVLLCCTTISLQSIPASTTSPIYDAAANPTPTKQVGRRQSWGVCYFLAVPYIMYAAAAAAAAVLNSTT